MLSRLVLYLALSTTVSAFFQPQESLLNIPPSTDNFMKTSIFARRKIHLETLDAPISLPPTNRRTGFEDDTPFEGLTTFAHLPYVECTSPSANSAFDIGIVGHPFDLGVSYRPGARFGPNGARQGARRLSPSAGFEYVDITWSC